MNRRLVIKQLASFAALSALGLPALAQGGPWAPVNPPQPTGEKGKVEVVEFFHYGCPHCRDFDPLLEKWIKALPKDVVFKRVPVMWNQAPLIGLAHFYYAAEAAGELPRLHAQVFAAVQDEKLPLNTEDGARDWVAKKGGNAKRFVEMYHSFTVETKLKRADQLARDYRIQGVPTLIVDGKYMTSASLSGSHENTIKVADQLIAKARAEQGRK
ncbi:MAG: thiol:disulfide interchange protein DsbA/DsbL [Zoogloea sp.]|nr:thiol:disulfide interchange protein DsbA/DsbL [Zoogloea sp.]